MRLDNDSAWELAGVLDYEPERELLERIEPLVDAIAEERSKSTLERHSRQVTAAVWADIREDVSESLERHIVELGVEVARAEAALAELERPARDNRLARAVVDRAALDVVEEADEALERMETFELMLEDAPAEERRALALPIAAEVAGSAAIPMDEAVDAARRFIESFPTDWRESTEGANHAAHWLGRTLATDERRLDMRAALAELADAAEEPYPHTAESLRALLDEPMPDDAAEDDLWINLVVGLAGQVLPLSLSLDAPEP